MDLRTLRDTPPWDWPADAGAALLGVLRDEHAAGSDRLLAAGLASDFTVIDDELAEALLSILSKGGELEELRAQAALSLGAVLEHGDMHGFEEPGEVPISGRTFHLLQESLRRVFEDAATPKDVRRRALEASVRAPGDWQADAVRAAFGSEDDAWKRTAVFCMGFVPGFDEQIVEALDSKDPDIQCEAVCAAGDRGVQEAWPKVAALVTRRARKPLLLAAINAVAVLRPQDAASVLGDLIDSDDPDIVEAVEEALANAEDPLDDDEFDDEALEFDGGTEVSSTPGGVRIKTKFDFGPKGLPLDQLGRIKDQAASANERIVPRLVPKAGRNEPCPCGSGKKFKKCCGR